MSSETEDQGKAKLSDAVGKAIDTLAGLLTDGGRDERRTAARVLLQYDIELRRVSHPNIKVDWGKADGYDDDDGEGTL